MTAPHSTTRADRGTTDGGNQKTIRALIVAMNSAVRAVRLYPVENTAVQKAIAELGACADRVRESEGHCTVRRVGDYLFVNDTRLRLTFDNYAAVAALLGLFREAGIGGVGTSEAPPDKEVAVLRKSGVHGTLDDFFPGGAALSQAMRSPDVTIEVHLAAGDARGHAWGCDLSADYVRINAHYTT